MVFMHPWRVCGVHAPLEGVCGVHAPLEDVCGVHAPLEGVWCSCTPGG